MSSKINTMAFIHHLSRAKVIGIHENQKRQWNWQQQTVDDRKSTLQGRDKVEIVEAVFWPSVHWSLGCFSLQLARRCVRLEKESALPTGTWESSFCGVGGGSGRLQHSALATAPSGMSESAEPRLVRAAQSVSSLVFGQHHDVRGAIRPHVSPTILQRQYSVS